MEVENNSTNPSCSSSHCSVLEARDQKRERTGSLQIGTVTTGLRSQHSSLKNTIMGDKGSIWDSRGTVRGKRRSIKRVG